MPGTTMALRHPSVALQIQATPGLDPDGDEHVATLEWMVDLEKADPTAADSAERGVQIGNPLAQTPGQVVQQSYSKTAMDFATVDFAAATCAASRDLVGDG